MICSALLVSACSGSSDPGVDGSLTTVDDELSEPAPSDVMQDPLEQNDNDDVSEPAPADALPDPLVQNDTEIRFSITVPAIMSDTLQLRLVWGDENFPASWVGDEMWSASAVFPTDTQHSLVVTFSNDNGALILGTFETELRTGTNASETFEIEANQFETVLWDNDNDGVSNIDEQLAGTDPLVDADSLLEIVDFIIINSRSGISVTKDFESRLTDERPFFEEIVREPNFSFQPVEANDDVDIDADGNGTHTYAWDAGSTYYSRTGTRTRSANSISWEGVQGNFNGISFFHNEFINTVTVVDERTREFVEEIEGSLNGDYSKYWQISTRLTGILIEGTSMCEAVAGMGSMTFTSFNPNDADTVRTFSKAIDDQFWRVVTERDGVTSEHFARDLKMIYSDDLGNGLFICDFVDI